MYLKDFVRDMIKLSLLYDSPHHLRYAIMVVLKWEIPYVGTYQLTELQWKHIYSQENEDTGKEEYFISTKGGRKERTQREISEQTYKSMALLKRLAAKSGKQGKLSWLSSGMEEETIIKRTASFVDSHIKSHFRGLTPYPLNNIFVEHLHCYKEAKKRQNGPHFSSNDIRVTGIVAVKEQWQPYTYFCSKMKVCLGAFQDYCNRNLIFDDTQKDPYGNWYHDQTSNYNRCMRAHCESDDD